MTFEESAPPRVLLYCASNIGLGHLHRLKCVASALRRQLGTVDILLLTDTQNLTADEIDPDIAIVRLPEYEFREGTFKNRAAGLTLGKQQLRDLRANLILATAVSFRPHVILMDTNPHGKRYELDPMLKFLASRSDAPLRILQLRDIPFPPGETRRIVSDEARVADDFGFYDFVFIAGDPGLFDLAEEYAWPDSVRSKIGYAGFMIPAGHETAGREVLSALPAEKERNNSPAHIVASMGGGWGAEAFGRPIIEAFIRLTSEKSGSLRLTLVTGPAIDESDRSKLEAIAAGHPGITIDRYTADFHALLASCSLAVLQAGSTPYQILESDIPMLLYCRDYSTGEQELRAERLGRFPGVERLAGPPLEVAATAESMKRHLDSPRRTRRTGFHFDGAERVARTISTLLKYKSKSELPDLKMNAQDLLDP